MVMVTGITVSVPRVHSLIARVSIETTQHSRRHLSIVVKESMGVSMPVLTPDTPKRFHPCAPQALLQIYCGSSQH